MRGRVELHHRPPGLGLLGVHLLEADPAGAGEPVDVPAHREQIGVAGDRPEPVPAGVVVTPPAHRVVAAQPLERGVRDTGGVGVRVGDVGVGRPQVLAGRRPGHAATRSRANMSARTSSARAQIVSPWLAAMGAPYCSRKVVWIRTNTRTAHDAAADPTER